MNSIESKLIELGGNPWEGGGHRRIYLNNALELAGLEVTRYGTGNIKGASLDGEKISNAKAYELASLKVFWDCNAGALVIQGSARMGGVFRERLEAAIDRAIHE